MTSQPTTPQHGISKNAPARARVAVRRREALALRIEGFTYDQIADTLKADPETVTPDAYSRSEAWRDVNEEMKAIRSQISETARDVLLLELERLDGITRGHYDAACNGDARAALTVLRCMDRRARLLGLDEPTRHEMVLTPEMVTQEIERLQRELGITGDDTFNDPSNGYAL